MTIRQIIEDLEWQLIGSDGSRSSRLRQNWRTLIIVGSMMKRLG